MASDSDGGSDDDSRTANVAAQASSHASAKSSASNSPAKPKRKRARKREKARQAKLALSSGASFSESAAYLDPSAATNVDDPPTKDTLQDSPQSANMASSFGKNRLASGFAPRQAAVDNTATAVARVQVPNNNTLAGSPSTNEPIEISSSDESSSVSDNEDGGMIVNISSARPKISQSNQAQIHGEHVNTTIPPPPPPSQAPAPPPPPQSSGLRLEDLDSDDLEDQIRYTLFHLDRDQIDLNRPVTCLTCLEQGHMSDECPEDNCDHCDLDGHSSQRCPKIARCSRCRQPGHQLAECISDLRVTTVPCDICNNLSHVEAECNQRFFPKAELDSTEGGPVRLWVSCCICASKSHLVGDCPEADRAAAARWSLKSLEPGQYVNRSLETGMQTLESDAANRNMRPPGLQIRGRSDLRHAVHSEESSEEGEFIRPPVKPPGPATRRVPDFQFGSPREQPRFGEPPNNGDARGRSSWYATDSFGARRSRSPKQAASDRYRPGIDRQRSPRRFDSHYQERPRSPPRRGPPPPGYDSYNSYRPDNRSYPPSYHNSGYNSRPSSPDRSRSQMWPTMTLPTRKGSNPNLARRVSVPNSNANASAGGPPKKKKKARARSQKFNTAS
jgi:hypothetical protein